MISWLHHVCFIFREPSVIHGFIRLYLILSFTLALIVLGAWVWTLHHIVLVTYPYGKTQVVLLHFACGIMGFEHRDNYPFERDMEVRTLSTITYRPSEAAVVDHYQTQPSFTFWDYLYGTDYSWSITFPFWLPFAVLILPPTTITARHLLKRRHQRHHKGLCPYCGYDLRASPHRCPECGTPINGNTLNKTPDSAST